MKYYHALLAEHAAEWADDPRQHPASAGHAVRQIAAERRNSASSRESSREEARKPRKPHLARDQAGSLGFLGPDATKSIVGGSGSVAQAAVGRPACTARATPTSTVKTTWRDEVDGLSEEEREAWEERAAIMEYEGGLDRGTAERKAFMTLSASRPRVAAEAPARAESPRVFWDQLEGMLHYLGFYEVDPAELDDYKVVPWEGEASTRPWACENPYCLKKGRWWRSIYGVVNCENCRPPAFPHLVVERGATP